MRRLINRTRKFWVMASSGGLTLAVLEGCDADVRDTVLNGVEGAATGLLTTFISAFFQSLNDPEETATTVQAIIEMFPQIVA